MSEASLLVLVVEDEVSIANVLLDFLSEAGFETMHVTNGLLAVETIRKNSPALVILDVMLPGLDGVKVCEAVRKFSDVPIIMATAMVEEIDRLLGLETGADDYICKPFSPREVVARVKTILRRLRQGATEKLGESSIISVDELRQRIFVLGQPLDLTPTEFRLFRLLASHPGRIYSRPQILELAYYETDEVSDRIIDSHIKNIRKKVAAVMPDVDLIHSVYGVGYRFEMPT
jgi:two-component system response regulator BaeR